MGRTRSKRSLEPPIIELNSPLLANSIPPETGQSTKFPKPELSTCSAILNELWTSIVDVSMTSFDLLLIFAARILVDGSVNTWKVGFPGGNDVIMTSWVDTVRTRSAPDV